MNTSAVLESLLGAALVAIPILLGVWLWREGFRQGDHVGDASSAVEVLGTGETFTVRATITNPQPAAVMAAVRVANVGPHNLWRQQGRSTRRRRPDLSRARLLAVDAHGEQHLDWAVEAPLHPGLVRVDIYIWQAGGRVRLHRYVGRSRDQKVALPARWSNAA